MNKKDIQLQLLKELDAICREENIKYFLHGENARNAYLHGTLQNGPENVRVIMTQGDAERFVEVMSGRLPESRYIECLANNSRYRQTYIAYGDSTTSDFDLKSASYDINMGIHVRILFVGKTVKRRTRRIRNLIYKFWKIRNSKIYSSNLWYIKLGLGVINGIIKLLGEKRVGKWYYNFLRRKVAIENWNAIADNEQVKIGTKVYSPECISDLQYVKVDDMELPIPCDVNSYFTIVSGENWETKEIKVRKLKASRIISTQVDFRQMETILKDYMKKVRSEHEMIKFKRAFAILSLKKVKRLWTLVLMTKEQVAFKRTYEEQKEYIQGLNVAEHFDELSEVLAPAKWSILKYAKKGMTYLIAPEIDEKLEALMLAEGREKQVAKIKRLRNKVQYV